MIISHAKKFAMYLPWKTASQSMVVRLEGYNDSPYDRFFYFNSYLNRVVHQHIICADFACLPESRLGYFTASFVRNPYDRVYSGFRQLQKDLREQPHTVFSKSWIKDLVMKQLTDNFEQLSRAQFRFDEWLAMVSEDQIYEAGRNSNFPLHPSHYWTHLGGNQVVDFVGKVEDFETDFQDFLGRVGITEVQRRNSNVVELAGDAANNPFGYRYISRMNKDSLDKINQLFKRDFDLFGYEQIRSHDNV
jgi:hypothetical protein